MGQPKPVHLTPLHGRLAVLRDAVAYEFGVNPHKMFDGERIELRVRARQLFWFLANERFGTPKIELGRLSGRCHTTVITGIRRVNQQMVASLESYSALQERIRRIEHFMAEDAA